MAEIQSNIPHESDESSFDLIETLRLLWRKKKFIISITAVVTVATVIIAFIVPETFQSTSIILPETDKSKLSGLGGLADLASMAGVGPGETSPVKLYPTILKSEIVLKPVIYKKYQTKKFPDSTNLIQFWEINAKTPEYSYELTLRNLRDGLNIVMDNKTSVITITLETEDAQLTADIINSITAGLDEFMRTKRTTNATKQRQWIEARLLEVREDLTNSENRIKDFREKNRIILGSPQLMLEQDRLLREVQINNTLYVELKKQFELIKIEEIKNTPIVNVMDRAMPAAKKIKPKRGIMVSYAFFLTLLGTMGYVFVKENYGYKFAEIKNRLKE